MTIIIWGDSCNCQDIRYVLYIFLTVCCLMIFHSVELSLAAVALWARVLPAERQQWTGVDSPPPACLSPHRDRDTREHTNRHHSHVTQQLFFIHFSVILRSFILVTGKCLQICCIYMSSFLP